MDRHGPGGCAAHAQDDPHVKSHLTFLSGKKTNAAAVALSGVAVGRWSTVYQVAGEGALRRRLLDMGLTPRTKVLVRKTAPLGDPIELRLRGYDLSLRKADAANILVLPE